MLNLSNLLASKRGAVGRTVRSAPILQQLGLLTQAPPTSKKVAERPIGNVKENVGTAYSPSRKEPDSKYIVFTDGSALNNGKKNARAGYAMVWPRMPEFNFAEPLKGADQTNNRAEYQAAISSLERANISDPAQTETLYIYTDSMLLINTVTKWSASWKRKGWKKADGQTVANLDLVKRLDDLTTRRRVVWTHVSAHSGKADWMSRWNDVADQMAKKAAHRA